MTLPLHDYPDWQQPLATADVEALYQEITPLGAGAAQAGTVDMRSYQNYALTLTSISAAAATAFNNVRLEMRWVTAIAGRPYQFRETYDMLGADAASVNFQSPDGGLHLNDRVHGAYLTWIIINLGADPQNVRFNIIGSTRPASDVYLRGYDPTFTLIPNDTSEHLANIVGFPLAAAAVANHPMRMLRGRVRVTMSSFTTPHTYFFLFPDGTVFDGYAVAAGASATAELVFPTKSVRIQVTNTGAIAGTHTIQAIGLRDTR